MRNTLCQLLPDVENPLWNCMSRTDPKNPLCVKGLAGRQAPQTVRFGGENGQIQLNNRYRRLFESWNTQKAIKYSDRNGGGWHNKGSSVQQLSFALAVLEVLEVKGERIYFRHFYMTRPPQGDYCKHAFTCVTADGETVEPPCGPLWIFPIARKSALWVDKRAVRFL